MNMPVMIPKIHTHTPAPVKRYFARVAHSRFVFEDGSEVVFAFGKADIDILEHQKELDAILGKNPNIYVMNIMPEKQINVAAEIAAKAKSEAEVAEQDRKLQGLAGRETGELNAGPVTLASTMQPVPTFPINPDIPVVDPEIQAAMQEGKVGNTASPYVGPGAVNKLEEIRRAAAAAATVQPLDPGSIDPNTTGFTLDIKE